MKDLEVNNDEASRNFELAVQLVKSLPQKGSFQPSYTEAGKIYSFFKQAKFGPCNIPRPGFWDYINRAKWDAWAALGDLSKTEAMINYASEIKTMYIRVKDLDEFIEREHEFSDVLIPFCQTNNIIMSEKLIEIVKKQNKNESRNENDDGVVNGHTTNNYDVNNKGNGIVITKANEFQNVNGDGNHVTDDNDEIDLPVCESQDYNHSLLVENTMPTELKSVTFSLDDDVPIKSNENENENVNVTYQSQEENVSSEINKTGTSEEDDEEYCDTIDPESFTKPHDSINESSLITTDSGTHFEEKTSNNKILPVRKRTNMSESSSDSRQECLQRELEKPYYRIHKRQDKKVKYRHHGMRSHKRLDEESKGENGQQSSNSHHRSHSAQTSRATNITQSNRILHNQQQNPDDRTDSSENYNSSNSSHNSSNSIGLKIVNSLERMEDNMQSVIDRLDSIEETIREVTKPTTPWWKQFMPSKTVLIWTVWPVVVNALFYIYWKRLNKKKLKKC